MRNALIATIALAAAMIPAAASAANGTISVEVRDQFGVTIAGGAKLDYGCGSGFRTVQDGTADDRDSRPGFIQVVPDASLGCTDGRPLSIRVYGLTDVGYLDWTGSGQYTSTGDDSFVSFMQFTLLVDLKSEFGQYVQNVNSVTATFTDPTATVAGHLSPEKTRVGFPVPMGSADGTVTIGGLGALGFTQSRLDGVRIPKDLTSLQSGADARLPFSVFVIGRDELSGDLEGSGGSATWNGASQIGCQGDGGRSWGCPVPLGSAPGTVMVSRPGYADYRTGAVSVPSSETGGRTTVQSANPFTIRVLGIGDWRGESLAASATTTLPAGPFLATTEILDARRQGDAWLVAAVPHGYPIQLTVQIYGYRNTTVSVTPDASGQVTADYDDDSLTPHWSATFDGPPLYPDLKVTVLSDVGAPAAGSSVRIYASSTLSDSYLADDLVGSGAHDAVATADAAGTARIALGNGSYWLRVTRSGDGKVFDKALGYIESGGAYNVSIGGEAASSTPSSGAPAAGAAFSSDRSAIAAEPLSIPADGVSSLTVTVDVRDAYGSPLAAREVRLSDGRGSSDSIAPQTAWTDASGRATFALKSTLAGVAQIGALIGGASLGKSVSVSFLAPGSTASAIAPGTIVKLPDDHDDSTAVDTTVYYVAGNGKRYFFPNEKIFRSWYGSYAGLRIVDAATMASIPLGGVVRYRPGVRMVKMVSTPQVYAVSEGGVLREVASETVAEALYGADWAASIDDLPEVFLPQYSIGTAIVGSGDYSPAQELERTPTIESDLGL